MRVYLDASVIVSMLTKDALNDRARTIIPDYLLRPVISDFALSEFASSVARRVRTGDLSVREAEAAFERLDRWVLPHERIETTSPDVRAAEALIRRLDLPLRTPDALNIALARRSGAALATFDRQMAEAARQLGLEVFG